MQLENQPAVGGITAANRDRLARLHRALPAPFTVAEAANVLGLGHDLARRLLAYLTARGWLARVRRNLYITVPIEASVPSQWRADPWVVAADVFAPGYIGGWSAGEHWDLTEQIFRTVVVISAHATRSREVAIQGTDFLVKTTAADQLFGTTLVWREAQRVPVSDPTRTIVDVLDEPWLGGGIRHGAQMLQNYFISELRDDRLLLDYADRLGNRTVHKRLGYLLETLAISAPALIDACLVRKSRGYSLLDPGLPADGPRVRRWNLRLNATIDPDEVS